MLYLIEDNKCYYDDRIICEKPNCKKCETFVNKKIKKELKITEDTQLNLFDLINEKRNDYAKRNNK